MAYFRSPALLVGKNRRGLWVVRDPLGLRGGLFTSRAEATRFATLNHGRQYAAILVPYPIELETVSNNG